MSDSDSRAPGPQTIGSLARGTQRTRAVPDRGRLPLDTGMGFTLVQHLDFEHEGAPTQILVSLHLARGNTSRDPRSALRKGAGPYFNDLRITELEQLALVKRKSERHLRIQPASSRVSSPRFERNLLSVILHDAPVLAHQGKMHDCSRCSVARLRFALDVERVRR